MAATFAAPVVPALRAPRREPTRASGGLRITRRGRLVIMGLALLVVLLPGAWRAMATAQVEGPSTVAVTVQPGDTLWGIASSVDPGADPRGVIAEIRELNGLAQSGLVPGQVLQVPAR